jgi:hypothetical protein
VKTLKSYIEKRDSKLDLQICSFASIQISTDISKKCGKAKLKCDTEAVYEVHLYSLRGFEAQTYVHDNRLNTNGKADSTLPLSVCWLLYLLLL